VVRTKYVFSKYKSKWLTDFQFLPQYELTKCRDRSEDMNMKQA